jgi:hypothetical protein
MGITLERARSMYVLYILISRRNPGSVDQPWITCRNTGLLRVQTLDQARSKPWIIDVGLLAGRTNLPSFVRQPQCGWAVFEVFRPMACQLYTTTIGTPQQTDEPWLARQIEHKSVKMGRVGSAFPARCGSAGLSDRSAVKFRKVLASE